MNIPPSQKIDKLIDQLFAFNANHILIVDQLIAIGRPAIPELMSAIRTKEFRHAQNKIDTDQNIFRHIAKALVGIVENETDPLVKNRLSLQIVNEMTIHMKWQIELSISPLEDFEAYKKAFDDNLFNKASESALALGQLKDARALPHLLEVINNRNIHPTIRENVILALGQIGGEQTIPHLVKLINRCDTLRHFAVKALAQTGSLAAVPPLLNSLETISCMDLADIQAHIIWALGKLHDPRAAPMLIEWVKTSRADLRAVAIQALGSIGYPSAIPVLEVCLNDATVLNRQDWGGTFWLFRTYRQRKVCDMAFEALQEIGTPNALMAIERWQASQSNSNLVP
jgi:HEAT repeat protein